MSETSFEIMTDKRLTEVEITLKEVQNTLHKLYNAVVGSDEFDQDGLIKRIKRLERDNENTKAFKYKLMGVSALSGTILAIIFEGIKFLVSK